ncbi:hypothetical protein DL96DRAFT_1799744 [Flagelloscypha sp. PMI_526]|nr:hypothetical protein DL96DRAFT_1799744 [Flagelloscypha sp. PMI_526]
MSKSPTPTNTHSPSRTGTPTNQRRSAGNLPRHESPPQPEESEHLVSSRPGPSKRRRQSTSSTETISKRARVDTETMRSSPSVDSNDGIDDTQYGWSGIYYICLRPPQRRNELVNTGLLLRFCTLFKSLQSKFPTTAMREEVGRSIGLSARKVQIWFQNQRQKMRRPKTATSSTEPSVTTSTSPRPPALSGRTRQSDPGPILPASAADIRIILLLLSMNLTKRFLCRDLVCQDSVNVPRLEYRDPSPRPSTSHSSYNSGYSSFEGVSPTAPVFAHYLPSPTTRKDPSRTLPPLAFGGRSSMSSSSASLSSHLSPTAPSFDHDIARISPTNQFGLTPPFALEPQPQWNTSAFTAPVRSSSLSSSFSDGNSPAPASPSGHPEERVSPQPSNQVHDHDSPRVGRYDPIRDGFIPVSPDDEQQQRSPRSP